MKKTSGEKLIEKVTKSIAEDLRQSTLRFCDAGGLSHKGSHSLSFLKNVWVASKKSKNNS